VTVLEDNNKNSKKKSYVKRYMPIYMDFIIKTNDKNPQRFDLTEVIFKCELIMYKHKYM